MSTLTRAKLACALLGIAAFGVGIRLQDDRLRWTGLGLVALAWLLRFAGPRRDDPGA